MKSRTCGLRAAKRETSPEGRVSFIEALVPGQARAQARRRARDPDQRAGSGPGLFPVVAQDPVPVLAEGPGSAVLLQMVVSPWFSTACLSDACPAWCG